MQGACERLCGRQSRLVPATVSGLVVTFCASAALAQMGSDALVLVEPWHETSFAPARTEPCAVIHDIQEPWEQASLHPGATGDLSPVAGAAAPGWEGRDAAILELLVTPVWAAHAADVMWAVADVPMVVEPWTNGSSDLGLSGPPAPGPALSDPLAIPTAAFPIVE